MELKITEVSYSYTQNLGHYQGQKVGASAQVDPEQNPEEVLLKLQNWVIDHLPKP